MNVLLDTHALIWFLESNHQLSAKAHQVIEDEKNVCFISLATGWEMTIKTSLGKLIPPIPIQNLFPTELEQFGFDLLPIQVSHLHHLLGLPLHHRDPFDRMLLAQALSEDFTIVNNDAVFDTYGVRRIW